MNTVWVKTAEQRPPTGSLIVKRWNNGAVWAGHYVGTDKDSSFDEWVLLETTLAPDLDARLLTVVREKYCSDDDIAVDDNAATSEADNGTWVQGWLFIPLAELPADNPT